MATKKAKLEIDSSSIKQMEKLYGDQEAFFAAYNDIRRKIAARLTSWVRAAMVASYGQSGIKTSTVKKKGDPTGHLIDMVRGCYVAVTKKGMLIRMRAGFTKQDYEKAGGINYGAVRTNVQGAKLRRKLKKNAKETGNSKGAVYVKPHPYFLLSDAQVQQMSALYQKYLQEEYDKFIRVRERQAK